MSRGDGRCLVLLVGAVDDSDAVTVGSAGSDRRRLSAGGEDVGTGLDDLGRAAMVRRQPDDLDPREPVADLDQQARVGAVEGEDRLRRVADEEQVVVVVAQEIDEPVLDRVQVLRLVDEQMPEAPSSGGGEVVVVLQRVDGEAEHVVEVDDTAPPLVVAVVGEHGRDAVDARRRLAPGAPGLAGVRLGRDGPRRRPS